MEKERKGLHPENINQYSIFEKTIQILPWANIAIDKLKRNTFSNPATNRHFPPPLCR